MGRLPCSLPIPRSLLEHLRDDLAGHTGRAVDIEREVPVGGGSINDCYRLDTDAGRFFVKVNAVDRHPSLFEAEADGLHRLGSTGAIRVPKVMAFGEDHDTSYLLLEHIDSGLRSARFWEAFGRSLAQLHKNTSPSFGLERNNYIGTLKQVNTPCTTWAAFFVSHRLEPQVRMARNRKRLGDGDVLRFEKLYAELPSLFPAEPPALLHGDLWSGNFLCDASERPVLIDPAVYYGHREMDIAMTRLFGGFDDAFYAAYNNERPLQEGWQDRADLWNVYPLLVHVNLFGAPYTAQVQAILHRFT